MRRTELPRIANIGSSIFEKTSLVGNLVNTGNALGIPLLQRLHQTSDLLTMPF
jgi:hypothetical protein